VCELGDLFIHRFDAIPGVHSGRIRGLYCTAMIRTRANWRWFPRYTVRNVIIAMTGAPVGTYVSTGSCFAAAVHLRTSWCEFKTLRGFGGLAGEVLITRTFAVTQSVVESRWCQR
jgi:hypothetical protein